MTTDPRQNLPPQIADAIAKGSLIEAIKYLRANKPNLGLAEAKAVVEAIQRQQQGGGDAQAKLKAALQAKQKASAQAPLPAHTTPHVPHQASISPTFSMDPHVSPGEVPRTSSGASFLGFVAAIVAVVIAAVYFGS
jgi:hypothetical protein